MLAFSDYYITQRQGEMGAEKPSDLLIGPALIRGGLDLELDPVSIKATKARLSGFSSDMKVNSTALGMVLEVHRSRSGLGEEREFVLKRHLSHLFIPCYLKQLIVFVY